ncbi:hypothetical protein [Pontibacter chitinilyticus]|uniref:hypothetical protein n=1 Tax=Pontibacter chitinilyticus TaxID=2674989 RepID=UPI00321B4922
MKTRHVMAGAVIRSGWSILLGVILVIVSSGHAQAQSDTLKNIVEHFDAYRTRALQEKLYLHLDRPFYVCGETMWFKVYAVDGTLHKPLDMSKVAYVEVLDAARKPVLQGKVALKQGKGNGTFVLPVTLPSGSYVVRAYTNWMKNFSPDLYFEEPVTLVNTFTSLGPEPKRDSAAYAVQFFPEGGNLVQGVNSKVAFQAINKRTGKGIAVEGQVVDQHGNMVATLQTQRFGLGQFTFTPASGATYTALIQLPNGNILRQNLPNVYDKGFSLHLDDVSASQVTLTVTATGQQAAPVYLLGHARQMIAVAEAQNLQNGTAIFLIDKNKLAEGITHFTVFNSQKQPVCERLYFKRPTQLLQVEAVVNKSQYNTRDNVSLELKTQTPAGQATPADLSLAVYRLDALQAAGATDIAAYLWLSSDLKGTIEQPGYYLTATGPEAAAAAENLMLTHGWSRFRWAEVLQKQSLPYTFVPEYGGHFIRARVKHAETGGGMRGIAIYLASPGKHIRLYNGWSDVNGYVQFEMKDFYGANEIVVQSDFSKDSTARFEVLNPFSEKYSAWPLPALDLQANLQPELIQRHLTVQVQDTYFGKYQNVFQSPGIDSTAFYGKADETYLLDDYTRFKVMEEVMREYVPGVQVRLRKGGFHFMVRDDMNHTIFQQNPMVLLDGVPVFDINKIMAFDPLKIRKLEVMTRRYFNGPQVYEGLVSYTTYQGDLAGFPLDPHALLMEYEGLQLQREFYAPAYDTPQQRQSRLPDLRNLLYWAPDILTKADGKAAVNFYTSDQAGIYVVVVQGLTGSGLTGSKMITFEVKQPL